MTTPAITVAICTCVRPNSLRATIQSLFGQTLSKTNFQILIVANAADPAELASLRDAYPASDLIQWCQEPIQGLSRARNRAVRMARGEFLAFIDDDAMARPNWLTSILDSFKAFGPSAKAVGGRVEPIWTCPRPNWLHDELLGYLSLVDWGGVRRSVQREEWIAGTNMAFRTTALRETTGFLEALGRHGGTVLLSNEEQEVLDKIRDLGGLVIYAPEVCVDHTIPSERLTQSWFRKRAAWQAISDYMRRGDELDRDIATHRNRLSSYWDTVCKGDLLTGLHGTIDDAAMFRDQLNAVYDFTILSISGAQLSNDEIRGRNYAR